MSLASAIRAAVGGRKPRSRLEDDKPEELEEDQQPDEAEDDPENPDAEGEEDIKPDADEDEPVADDDDKPNEYARGRKAERKRMSAILGSAKADQNPSLAAHLAFNTNMSAKQALATLSAGAGGKQANTLSSRMHGRVPALGNGGINGGSRAAAGSPDEKLIAHAKARSVQRQQRR